MSGTHWWLSFCDPARPKGQQFLGIAIVGPAFDIGHAAMLARMHGCNPGGEVFGLQIPVSFAVPTRYQNRLLSRDEAEQIDGPTVMIGDLEEQR